jgi:hypothetical protein
MPDPSIPTASAGSNTITGTLNKMTIVENSNGVTILENTLGTVFLAVIAILLVLEVARLGDQNRKQACCCGKDCTG